MSIPSRPEPEYDDEEERHCKICNTTPSQTDRLPVEVPLTTARFRGPFDLHFPVQVGDASADNRVLSFDVSVINGGIPEFDAPDDDRRDINGDGRILSFDVSITNGSIPSFPVTKPSGH